MTRITDKSCDVGMIGADHTGLVSAYYLGKKGMKVRLFEASGVVRGDAVTEELHPGYRHSAAS